MGFDGFETVTVEELRRRRTKEGVFTPRERASYGQTRGSQRKSKNKILNREKLKQEALSYGLPVEDLIMLRAIEASDIVAAQKKHQDEMVRNSKKVQSKSMW